MNNPVNQRKIEHINVINMHKEVNRNACYFDGIHLVHRALPDLSFDDIDPSTDFMGKKIAFPLLISSMTGGDHELLASINRNLATAAQSTNVAMAVGSQRVLFEKQNARKSFDLRSFAPTIPLIANLGAVQLNYGFHAEHCEKAVEVLDGDGLYFHLNPLQEVIQPEGDTNFSSLLEKIQKINQKLSVPVLVKEIGCGIGPQDIKKLIHAGIKHIDIAGQGGTSWSLIEFHRDTSSANVGQQFQDWGIPTPVALQIAAPLCQDVQLIASGGLRNGLDMVKSIIMGAHLCGFAGSLLQAATKSAEEVIQEIEKLKNTFITAMFLLGVPTVKHLQGNSSLLLDSYF